MELAEWASLLSVRMTTSTAWKFAGSLRRREAVGAARSK